MIAAGGPRMWLLKTEPSTYSYSDLERDGKAVWDGVKNPAALRNIQAMKAGDRVLVYHTGDEKAVVGRGVVTKTAYPDPKSKNPRLLVVDLEPGGRLERPVSLAAIRGMPEFAQSPLVRQPRLSVVALTAAQWKAVEAGARE
jgi:predicted RNA-binding protein with PUA-like domain